MNLFFHQIFRPNMKDLVVETQHFKALPNNLCINKIGGNKFHSFPFTTCEFNFIEVEL